MTHAYRPLFRALPHMVSMLGCAAGAPAALAMSTAPASCAEFVNTYLQGGLPNGSTVDFALEVYSIGPSATRGWAAPATLTLGYPPYPAVAGQLSGASIDSPDILITFDHEQLHAFVRRGTSEIDVQILGCLDADHLYGSTGDEIVGLGLGNAQPPRTAYE